MPTRFRLPVTKTYPLAARIEVCDQLGDLVDSVVIGSMPRPERSGSGERMLLARWAHAQTNYGAALNLAREPEADGQSVAMLSRPLFEAMVDCYWIVKEPIKAQDLAVKHHRLLRIIVAENYNAWRLPGDPEMPIFAEDRAEQASFAKLFKPKAQRHWTTLDLRSRVRAVGGNVPQDSTGELEHQYDVDNQLANLLCTVRQ